MSLDQRRTGLELRSEITSAGELRLSFLRVPIPLPGPDEVVVQIEASPINPSDLGLLTGPADLATAKSTGIGEDTVLTAVVPPDRLKHLGGRLDQSMPVGNEAAGLVIEAGVDAQGLLGKTVAILGGGMYAEYRTLKAAACLPLPSGTSAADGASVFVNPLTALGMTETMRREGHSALVHTAAASNLGQMLVKLCLKDNIGLVNIVRHPEQVALLRDIGAEHVCDSSSPNFEDELLEAIGATGATLAFDAIGGGPVGGKILRCMETVAGRNLPSYSRYGSQIHKQLYQYGSLDPRPTEIDRSIGMAWSVGGWLVMWFLEKIGSQNAQRLRERVLSELTSTFSSRYTAEVSLVELLDLPTLTAYSARRTGEKYLVCPHKSLG